MSAKKPKALDETPNAVMVILDEKGVRNEYPYRIRTLPQQLKNAPIRAAVHGWLRYLSFDEVVNLWWEAQGELAAERERNERRTADPDDMFGKSAEYVKEYYRRNEDHPTLPT